MAAGDRLTETCSRCEGIDDTMRFLNADHGASSDAHATMQEERGHRPGDIVIRRLGAGTYVISKIAGEPIATSHDRFDAMRRACAAARETGANVWICVDGAPDTYHEVLCP